MRTFASIDELAGAVGEPLGWGSWHQVSQERINLFAEATGDLQWIHTDPARAAAGPYGTTIAHGYLTLALLPMLVRDLYTVKGVTMGVNYGLNRVRFPAPVRSGGSVRAGGEIAEVTAVPGGVQVVLALVVETDGGGKPCCVAESVSRLYTGEAAR